MIDIEFCFKFLILSQKKFKRGFNKSGISIFGVNRSLASGSKYSYFSNAYGVYVSSTSTYLNIAVSNGDIPSNIKGIFIENFPLT